MRKELLFEISKFTEEEKQILSGNDLDRKFYSAENDFIISDKRLTKGLRDITMRTHPRFIPFPSHRHTFCEMMLVFSGKITHRIAEEEIELTTGDILLMNKHVTHSISVTDTGDVGMNVIISDRFADILSPRLDGTLFSSFFKENARRDGRENHLLFHTNGAAEIENLTENLISEFLTDTPDEFIIKETLSLLFYHLSKKRALLLDGGTALGDRESYRRLEISSYVKNNYSSATLSEIASRLGLTEPYLSKLITDYFGKSFKELLLDERITRATELFQESDMPIGTVIRNMGYENESYFHKEYKKRMGMTPLAVRKAAKYTIFTKK